MERRTSSANNKAVGNGVRINHILPINDSDANKDQHDNMGEEIENVG